MPFTGGGGGAPVSAPYATFGVDATLTAETNLQQLAWVNLIKNSPGQIYGPGKDGAEPEWWDDVANATITDEDAAGEAIPDKTERVFKVVTTANDVYGYGTSTFADESLLDAGQTVVSFSCWVYCASASKASIGIYGTNLGLQESAQHTGSSTWELLTVENVTLNAADTSIQTRLIVDTGTAYFTMPMLNLGPKALPWIPRNPWFYVATTSTTQYTHHPTGDRAWADTDCTTNTDPLCTAVQMTIYIDEPDGSYGSYNAIGHNNTIMGADVEVVKVSALVLNAPWDEAVGPILCDDQQIIRYKVEESDADSDVNVDGFIKGYWRWEN